METITIHKASPIWRGAPIEPATIIIDLSIDDSGDSQIQSRIDGSILAETLWSHLPGATVDELIANLLLRRASQLRISFADLPVSA